jgi:hypothetical protein
MRLLEQEMTLKLRTYQIFYRYGLLIFYEYIKFGKNIVEHTLCLPS